MTPRALSRYVPTDPKRVPQEAAANAGSPSRTMDAFERIRADIMQGRLHPGARMKIEEMRAHYKVGLSPLREALSLLTSEHLVERIDQRGFRVAPASLAEFTELLQTRCWLEERALRESIRHGGAAWEEGVVIAHHRLHRLKRAAGTDHSVVATAWEDAHRAFHTALISRCGSTILLRFCDQLYDMNVRYRQIAGIYAYPRRNIETEHREIVKAALARDADAAVAKLVTHYEKTGAYLKKALA
ncbi:MAG: FCD domain-containing protein [Hyphomicrobiales bacterium]|nr:MAG: FCD domain-containing protein [Hyphomicrobiales bacterium]